MSAKLWGGRFAESTSTLVERFSESVSFDARLYRHDIRGSIAHARMLAAVGVLTADDVAAIVKGWATSRPRSTPANSSGRPNSKTCT